MKNNYKKIIATIAILATLHIPTAQADLNQGDAGAAAVGAGASGMLFALAGGAAVVGTGGIALAVFGFALLLNHENGAQSTKQNSPISIHLNPNTPLVTPPGWTPPVPPATQPTAPTTSSTTSIYQVAGQTFTTGIQACTSTYNSWCSNTGCNSPVYTDTNSTTGMCTAKRNDDGSTKTTTVNKLLSCPTGYSLSGSTCNLTNSAAVTKPKKDKMEIKRTGNSFEVDPQINPADIIQSDKLEVTPTKVTVKHTNGSKSEITINTDGTSTLKITEVNNTNNTTNVYNTNFSAPDSSGNVQSTGSTTNTFNGTGTATSTTPNTTPSTGTTPSLELPTDYNRESTQQEIKDLLKCDDCELPADVSEADQQKINDEIKKSTDMLNDIEGDYAGFKNLGWSNWVPTFPTGQCSPITGDIAGQHVSWDLCPHVQKLNELIGWLMNLFGAWTLTSMFFRRD